MTIGFLHPMCVFLLYCFVIIRKSPIASNNIFRYFVPNVYQIILVYKQDYTPYLMQRICSLLKINYIKFILSNLILKPFR